MRTLLATLLAACLASPSAHATEGLEWQWTDAPRRYMARAQVEMINAIPMQKFDNVDAAAVRFTLGLLLSCQRTDTIGKAAWEIRCDIDDAALSAEPVASRPGAMEQVLEEWVTKLRDDAWLQIVQTRRGRLRSIDLNGLPDGNLRYRQVALWVRQVVLRALAPFDLELPRKGDDKGRGAWVQRDALVFGIPSGSGAAMGLGGQSLVHQILQENEGNVTLGLQGDAVTQAGITESEALQGYMQMEVSGSALFDTNTGTLREAQYLAKGTPTASSPGLNIGYVGYVQAAVVTLVEEGETPDLGPSRVLEPKNTPAATTSDEPTVKQPAPTVAPLEDETE